MIRPGYPVLIAMAMSGLTITPPLNAAVPAKKAPATSHTAAPIAPAANGDVTRAQMLAQVKQVFNLADTNHDGFMSRAEFAARMGVVINRLPPDSTAAPTKEQAQKMLDAANNAFNAVDTNHDGKLSLTEASARPLAAFDAMDANHDGILTLAEKQAARDAQAAAQGGPIGPPVVAPTLPGH